MFGDYRNALTEDPRLYEDIVDYEAAKAVFDEVRVTCSRYWLLFLTFLGSSTSRFSGKILALLPRKDGWTRGFAVVDFHLSDL